MTAPACPPPLPARLTVDADGLLDGPDEPLFDDIVRLAARAAGAPCALLTLVSGDRTLVKSAFGLPRDHGASREIPRSHCLCAHVVASGEALALGDAREHPALADNGAVRDWGVAAYAATPLRTPAGELIGSLAVVDRVARAWPDGLLDDLAALARLAGAELALRIERLHRGRVEAAARDEERFRDVLLDSSPDCVKLLDLDGRLRYMNEPGRCLMEVDDFDQLAGVEWATVWPGDGTRLATAAVREALRGGVGRFEAFCPSVKGTPRWWDVTVAPVRNGIGEIVRLLSVLRDVSAARAAREAARVSEARAQLLLESAHEGICTVNAVGVITYANRRLADMLGRAADALVGRPIFDFMDADAAFAARTRFARHQRGVSDVHEVPFRRADGSVLWTNKSASALFDADGAFAGALYLMSDLTERRHADDRLRDSEARLAEAQRVGRIGSWEYDVETEAVHWSDEMFRLSGLTPRDEPLTLREFYETIHPADRDAYRWQLLEHLAARRGYEFTTRTRHPDGTVRVLRGRGEMIFRADGQPVRVVGTAHDVTEQVEAEAALRASEVRFRSLIENSSDMVALLDATGRYVYVSPASERYVGHAPEALLAANAFDLIHPDDREGTSAALAEALATPGASVSARYRFQHRDGGWRMLETVATNLLHDPAVRGIVTNSTDVTERVELEARLRQAQKMEAIGRLAGGVAHDFNNLLMVIGAGTQFAREAIPPGSPALADLAEVEAATARAAGLTRQLLAFGRQQVLRPTTIALNDVAVEIERMLRRTIGADVQLVVDLAPGLRPVHADAGQLGQVLMNLAVNARDAMPGGGRLTIQTRDVVVDAAEAARRPGLAPGDYVALRVTDTGVGMDETTLARVFEPFFTTKGPGQGTGLGLATVYGIVKQSGGHIHVDSTPGRGSTFVVYLPPDLAAEPPAAEGLPAAAPGGRETLLLVEDDAAVRVAVRRILERGGYTVLEAPHGAEALRLLERHAGGVSLVLTDAVMPEMGASQLLSRLRESHPALPALVMSGYSREAVATQGALADGVELLGKPFTREELLRGVRQALGARAA